MFGASVECEDIKLNNMTNKKLNPENLNLYDMKEKSKFKICFLIIRLDNKQK